MTSSCYFICTLFADASVTSRSVTSRLSFLSPWSRIIFIFSYLLEVNLVAARRHHVIYYSWEALVVAVLFLDYLNILRYLFILVCGNFDPLTFYVSDFDQMEMRCKLCIA